METTGRRIFSGRFTCDYLRCDCTHVPTVLKCVQRLRVSGMFLVILALPRSLARKCLHCDRVASTIVMLPR